MKLSEAKEVAGTLGFPSKMPGTSYGIPAAACKMGAKLVNVHGSVCRGCYALKGNYRFSNVAKAQRKRLRGLSDARWTMAMVTLLTSSGETWHRWHDAGDLQGVWHLTKICAVASATPQIKHWLPTRELKMVQDYVAAGGIVPDNLTIRISATMVDGAPTSQWAQTSSVHQDAKAIGRVCPAPKQGNECKKCRACWSRDIPNISYHKH